MERLVSGARRVQYRQHQHRPRRRAERMIRLHVPQIPNEVQLHVRGPCGQGYHISSLATNANWASLTALNDVEPPYADRHERWC